MKRKYLIAFSLIFTLAIVGCGANVSDDVSETKEQTEETLESNAGISTDDMFTKRDLNDAYDENESAKIQFNGDSAECSSNAVQIDGSTITIKDEGTYILSGTLNDGMIIVNADENDKLQLVFDNVTINSETSAPLYVLEADKVVVTLADGSENTLSNGGTFTAIDENHIDAVIFSKQDLSLNGDGKLSITSPAGHGIVSKDDLVFTGGTYIVESASHGLQANDSVRIVNTDLTIDAGKDGIHSENDKDEERGFVYVEDGTFSIEAEGDGVSAGAYLYIEDGVFSVVSGGGSVNAAQKTSENWGGFRGQQMGQRMNPQDVTAQSEDGESAEDTSDTESTSIKGLKAEGDVIIKNGTLTIDSADDAVHSNSSIYIEGGVYEIASGDDGVHADDTVTISDGTIHITKSYEGIEGLHVQISGGDIQIVSEDDGLNAAGGSDESGYGGPRGNEQFGGSGGQGGSASSDGTIVISGGNLFINASGDGIDANGTLEISGGTTTVYGPTQGDTSVLDYDLTGVITGGTFIGTGANMMVQTFSDSEQGVVSVNAGNYTAGTKITLEDMNGNIIMTAEPNLDFQIIILSSPEIVKGETYKLTVGEASGEFEAE